MNLNYQVSDEISTLLLKKGRDYDPYCDCNLLRAQFGLKTCKADERETHPALASGKRHNAQFTFTPQQARPCLGLCGKSTSSKLGETARGREELDRTGGTLGWWDSGMCSPAAALQPPLEKAEKSHSR